MPGAKPEVGGRQPSVAGDGAANVTGRMDHSSPEAERLMETILSRGNMMAALSRVVANKGAPGVDNMPVTALKGYLHEHWPRIKEELLGGKYRPQPVLKVAKYRNREAERGCWEFLPFSIASSSRQYIRC